MHPFIDKVPSRPEIFSESNSLLVRQALIREIHDVLFESHKSRYWYNSYTVAIFEVLDHGQVIYVALIFVP